MSCWVRPSSPDRWPTTPPAQGDEERRKEQPIVTAIGHGDDDGEQGQHSEVYRQLDHRVLHSYIQNITEPPTLSATGKTLVVASTRGNQKSGLQIDGKDVHVGVNAYVYAEPKGTR
jgi:hypothetical protein